MKNINQDIMDNVEEAVGKRIGLSPRFLLFKLGDDELTQTLRIQFYNEPLHATFIQFNQLYRLF